MNLHCSVVDYAREPIGLQPHSSSHYRVCVDLEIYEITRKGIIFKGDGDGWREKDVAAHSSTSAGIISYSAGIGPGSR